jgi:hypothetical protein
MLPGLIGIVKGNLSGASRGQDGRGEDGGAREGRLPLSPPQRTVVAESTDETPTPPELETKNQRTLFA